MRWDLIEFLLHKQINTRSFSIFLKVKITFFNP